jgi:hypothetical protein
LEPEDEMSDKLYINDVGSEEQLDKVEDSLIPIHFEDEPLH